MLSWDTRQNLQVIWMGKCRTTGILFTFDKNRKNPTEYAYHIVVEFSKRMKPDNIYFSGTRYKKVD